MKNVNLSFKKGLVFAVFTSLYAFSHFSYAGAATACQNVDEQKNSNTATCFQYVQGFLDGALLSDAQIISNLSTSPEMSNFAERAMRTRLGQRRGELPATYLANFCLPETTANDEVVFQVVDALKKLEDKTLIDAELIYSTIKNEFPC